MYISVSYIVIVLVLCGISLFRRKYSKNNLESEVAEAVGIYVGTKDENLRFPDETFKRRVLYWLTPGIDTTYFAMITLKKLDKLYGGTGYDSFVSEKKNKIEGFLRKHFDETTGGMKHNIEALSTVYGIYCGLTLLKELEGIPALEDRLTYRRAENLLGKNTIDGMARYLLQCESIEGGFSISPYRNRPTIIDTDAALSALWNLEQKPRNLENTKRFIWSCKRPYRSAFGFVNTPEENVPCVCLTSYAMRALLYSEAIRKDAGNFRVIRDDKDQQVISREDLQTISRFIQLCMEAGNGGFPKNPEEVPTLFHTDIVLNFVSSLSSQLSIEEIKEKINVLETIRWTKQRESKGGGFSFEPSYLPNVYSTRSGIVILSNLSKLFKDMSKFIISDGTSTYNKHRQFLHDCFDENVGGFSGYKMALAGR
ncbi:MAG: prenyltransferase/squalene oxidase repeat-containing protein [Candidatus Zixiibacteriota bacterium]